jgi:hypothetical protein
LDDFIAEYQKEMVDRVAVGDLKPGSLKAVKETFTKIKARFGSTLLSDITTEQIDKWLKSLPVCQRTRERHRAYTVQIFNKAKKLVTVNPALEIGTFNGEDEEIHFLMPEQVKSIAPGGALFREREYSFEVVQVPGAYSSFQGPVADL